MGGSSSGANCAASNALNQTEVTGSRSSLAMMASADWVQTNGFGAAIVFNEISVDAGLQVGDRVEDAAADALPGHLGKEALDGVEPGGRGRREMEGPTRMTPQPGQHFGMFVGGGVVEDDMD